VIYIRILDSFWQNSEKRLLVSSCLSFHLSAWVNSAAKVKISLNVDVCVFSKKCRKIQFSLKSGKNNRKFTWSPIYIYLFIYIYIMYIDFSVGTFNVRNFCDIFTFIKKCHYLTNPNFYFLVVSKDLSAFTHWYFMFMGIDIYLVISHEYRFLPRFYVNYVFHLRNLTCKFFISVWSSFLAPKALIQIIVNRIIFVLFDTYKFPLWFSSLPPFSVTMLCRPFSILSTAAVISYKKIRPGP
jgi:hypothetical protein